MTPVGVNLLWCRPGRVGGSEEYTTRLLGAVRAVDPSIDLTLFASRAFAAAHPTLTAQTSVDYPPAGTRQRAVRIVVERTWLPRHARRVDVVHHAGGTAPPVGRPIVLTIHDLQYRAFPQFFHPMKRAFLESSVPRAVARAAVITVPSEFVRADVHAAFAVPLDRIVVVPHMLPEPATPTITSDVRARYALAERFVVYPAVTWPHKNHSVLIEALARLDAGHADIGGVLLGSPGPGDAAVDELVARLGLDARVRRLGRVPDADRDALYRAALALAFPSRYEGFGAPVIEAMAASCPVIASATTALPEVVGDAGLLVDPDDASAWAAAITAVAGTEERRRLIEAGRRRVLQFTSLRSAELLVGAYRRALP
jgi:glycosyltransferase involved in cell wall biosynthesis